MLTLRLADSIPMSIVDEWKQRLRVSAKGDEGRYARRELARRIDKYLDAGRGSCLLQDPQAAALVEGALLHFDGDRYRLFAWVIMPNHVHVLLLLLPGNTLAGVTHSWKSFTARKLNALTGSTGRVWQPETYDRFIRTVRHYRRCVGYIHGNPPSAGLTASADEWRFSSAWKQGEYTERWREGEALEFLGDLEWW